MKNNIYFRWFWASLSENKKKDYREMSLNQQKDWYISYLESNYGNPGSTLLRKRPLQKK